MIAAVLMAMGMLLGLGGLSIGEGETTLEGGDDPEALTGSDGDDSLSGGGGSDLLLGHGGNDSLSGGTGNDWLFGGEGADQFIIPTPKRGDNYSHVTTLPDFDGSSGDKIRIRGAKNFINSAQFQGEKGEIRTEIFNPGDTDSGLNLLVDDNGDAEADRIVALPGTDLFRSNWLI